MRRALITASFGGDRTATYVPQTISIAPEHRRGARVEVARWLETAERGVPVWVRINPVATDDALEDLAAVIDARPDGIVLPKARDGADVHRGDHWLESLEARCGYARGSIGLLPLITESAGALLNTASFTALPDRVVGLTWGADDLAADIGASANKTSDGEYEFTFALARSFCLLAAAAAGVPAFDTIDTEFRDVAGLLASLGPVVGLDRVRRGLMSREEYILQYGHRGPHETEISSPRPAENPNWIEEQIEGLSQSPSDVDGLCTERLLIRT